MTTSSIVLMWGRRASSSTLKLVYEMMLQFGQRELRAGFAVLVGSWELEP